MAEACTGSSVNCPAGAPSATTRSMIRTPSFDATGIAGEVLPRSLIASQVWDMNFDSDTNVIEVAMRRLRAKVDDAFEPKLIRTVRGMGYCQIGRAHV